MASHTLRAIRWKMLIEPLGYKPKNSNMIFSVFIGYIANLAFPRMGEIMRCTILTKYEKVPFNKGIGTVITERSVDMIMFGIVFVVTILIEGKALTDYLQLKIYAPLAEKANLTLGLLPFLLIVCAITIAVLVLVWLIFKNKLRKSSFYIKIIGILKGFTDGIISIFKMKKPWLFIFYSLAIWFFYYIMAYIVFFSLPSCSHLSMVAGLATLTFGTIGIMVTPGGIGLYPLIISEVLALYGVTSTQGYTMGWLIWLSQNATILIIGLTSLILLPIVNKSKNGQLAENK